MNDKVLYTAITRGYDRLPAVREWPGWDFVCLTDDFMGPTPRAPWRLIRFGAQQINAFPAPKLSRAGMILPHQWLPSQYRYSIYCDANQTLTGDPSEFCSRLDWPGFALPKHYARDCIYEELIACYQNGKCSEAAARLQIQHYSEEGMPKHAGMWDTGVILRRHNDRHVIRFDNQWWKALDSSAVLRDQPALAYAIWKAEGGPVTAFANSIRLEYFKERAHGT